MERLENPMTFYRPEDEDPVCHNCGDDNAMNDVEVSAPDGDMVIYYCDECYNNII